MSELVGDDEDALEALALDDRAGGDRVTHSGNRRKADDLKNITKNQLTIQSQILNTIKLGYTIAEN